MKYLMRNNLTNLEKTRVAQWIDKHNVPLTQVAIKFGNSTCFALVDQRGCTCRQASQCDVFGNTELLFLLQIADYFIKDLRIDEL